MVNMLSSRMLILGLELNKYMKTLSQIAII